MLAAIRDPVTLAEMSIKPDAELLAALKLAEGIKPARDPIALAVRFVRDGSAAAEASKRAGERKLAEGRRAEAQRVKLEKAREAQDAAERDVHEEKRRMAIIAAAPDSAIVDALRVALATQTMIPRRTRDAIANAIDPARPVSRGALDCVCGSPFVRAFVSEFLMQRDAGPVTVPVE